MMSLDNHEKALDVVHAGLKVEPTNADLLRFEGELVAKRQRLDQNEAGPAPTLATLSQNTVSNFSFSNAYFVRQAAHMPLRLTDGERVMLRLLEGALTVSDYTNKVDIVPSGGSYHYGFGDQSVKYGHSYGGGYGGINGGKLRRVVEQAKDVLSMLSGLLVTHDMRKGAKLVGGQDRGMRANEAFFQRGKLLARS
jgi:hypothetical protein